MFSTSLATAAVAGLLASGSLAPPPAWQTDYQKALAQASEQQKPVAVFIAPGGYAQLVQEGALGAEAAKLLRQNYVCLSVDTQTTSGKELAKAFQINQGVVISDRTGGVQALRHEGTVTQTDLTGYLSRYSGRVTVVQTEYAGVAQPVYGQPAYQSYTPNRPILNAIGNVRQFFGGG